ncbi:Receptor-like protein kinase ANXUR2 [Glycine max]|nr:Receptor-like protein kinase ANXUR2 [Glycine max]
MVNLRALSMKTRSAEPSGLYSTRSAYRLLTIANRDSCYLSYGFGWESMRWKRVVGPLAASPASHFIHFCEGFGAGRNEIRWPRWWIALTSSIWKHRNLFIFQGNRFEPPNANISAMAQGLCCYLSLQEMKQATKNFDESNVIGVGGFGKVYKRVIDNGFKVAIKRSNPQSRTHQLTKKSDVYSFGVVLSEALYLRKVALDTSIHSYKIGVRISWRLFLDRLPTRGNLSRRSIPIQDITCPLCGCQHEEAGHLFFHCKMTKGLWWESMRWIRGIGALPADPASHFIQFCHYYCGVLGELLTSVTMFIFSGLDVWYVCGRVYCRQCVEIGMGDLTEGRKCMECLGLRFSQRYIERAGMAGCCGLRYPSTLKHVELNWAEKGPRRRGDRGHNNGHHRMASTRPRNPANQRSPLSIASTEASFVMSATHSPFSAHHHHIPL